MVGKSRFCALRRATVWRAAVHKIRGKKPPPNHHLEWEFFNGNNLPQQVGEVMAQRLLESGITRVYWDIGDKK